MALWLGLDLGTSAAKALLVDERGTVRARAVATYGTRRGPGGVAEQDPGMYLAAVRDLIGQCRPAGVPDAIGLCGQTPTLVLVDRDGRIVRPAMTWQDVRATAEAAELEQTLGDATRELGTWLPWSSIYAPAKLLWLARHEPHIVEETALVLQPKDLVGRALTGAATSDLWSSRGLRNLVTGHPALGALRAAGWGGSVVPQVAPPWASRGDVTPEAAREFGLPAGIPVAVGWTDALAALLALGVYDEPSAFVVSGTADIVGVSTSSVPANPSPLIAVPDTCTPLPLVYGPIQSTGAALAWSRALFGGGSGADRHPERSSGDARPALAAPAPLVADGPVFVPYLSGERAPIWRDDVRGLFVGLGVDHRAPDLMRAVELGVACADRDVLDKAEAVAGRREEVRACGATAALPGWPALRAGVLGRPLLTLREPEASALGAAMLAASAAGEALNEVAPRLRGPLDRVEPAPADIARGDVAFARYCRARDIALAWADGDQDERSRAASRAVNAGRGRDA